LINGIIEYDQKLPFIFALHFIHRRPIKKKCWKIIFYFVFVYYVCIASILLTIIPLKTINITTFSLYFFRLPFAIDVTVVISTYFYLQNLECRFQTLNGFWTQLPDGLTTTTVVSGGLTHVEITILMDKIRRLHADLSELLRIFSTGFGQMLLGFFVFNYINIVISFFYIIQFRYDLCGTDIIGIVKRITPYLLCTQNSFLIMSIIIAASRVNDTVSMKVMI